MLHEIQSIEREAMRFVIIALAGKSASKEYLRHLCVKDGVVWGSDGARMHWTKTSLKDGLYLVEKNTQVKVIVEEVVKANFTYPDVKAVLPESYEHTTEINFTENFRRGGHSIAIFELFKKTKMCLDIDYLASLKELFTVKWNEPNKGILFEGINSECVHNADRDGRLRVGNR